MLKIDIDNGKYTLEQGSDYKVRVLRYGDYWLGDGSNTPLYGSKFIVSMGCELEDARAALVKIASYSRGGVVVQGEPSGDRDEMIGIAREVVGAPK